MIDLDALSRVEVRPKPFFWCDIGNIFESEEHAQALLNKFPSDGFTHCESKSETKRYSMEVLSLSDDGQSIELDPNWMKLRGILTSRAYLEAVAALAAQCGTPFDLDDVEVEINLWRYGVGSYLGPHPDDDTKILTQMIYFNSPDWRIEDGGCLHILNGNSEDRTAHVVRPCLGRSAIIFRSETSWHSVSCQRREDETRKALQIVVRTRRA